MHPVQRRLILKNLKFWALRIVPLALWAWLWYEGFKTF